MGQLFIGCTGVIKLGLIWTQERQFVKTFTALIVFSVCCMGQGWRSIILFSKAWYHRRQGQISIMCPNHYYCVIPYYHKTTICCIIIFGCQFSLCIISCITSLFLKKKKNEKVSSFLEQIYVYQCQSSEQFLAILFIIFCYKRDRQVITTYSALFLPAWILTKPQRSHRLLWQYLHC